MNNNENISGISCQDAGITKNDITNEQIEASGFYTVVCYDSNGNVKWEDNINNVVTSAGRIDALDKYLAGSTYTAAWYLGLISSVSYTGVPVIADTMASHATWTEAGATNAPAYSQGARPTAAWSAASGTTTVSKALSASLTFSITSSGTVKGAFLNSVATKDGTTGVLYSAGLFTGGDKIVANLDTLSVSYTTSLT